MPLEKSVQKGMSKSPHFFTKLWTSFSSTDGTIAKASLPVKDRDKDPVRDEDRSGRPPADPVVLALRDIEVAYSPGHTALALAALDIHAGRVYAVIGPNGAGKTTLFRVLTLITRPQSGCILWHGQDMMQTAAAAKVLRQHVVWVSQQPLLFRTSVFHNVAYGLRIRGVPRRTCPSWHGGAGSGAHGGFR